MQEHGSGGHGWQLFLVRIAAITHNNNFDIPREEEPSSVHVVCFSESRHFIFLALVFSSPPQPGIESVQDHGGQSWGQCLVRIAATTTATILKALLPSARFF